MIVLGINDSSHDAGVSLVHDNKILFAGHAERYDKKKNTFSLNSGILSEALSYGFPDVIAYFEKRSLKKMRLALRGGINGAYTGNLYKKQEFAALLENVREVQIPHHKSHACAGFLTSPFDEAAIVVVDAIGEFETTSIWVGRGDRVKKLWSMRYPTSFGLFYSFMTSYVGLRPCIDEYILMGMAGFGDKERFSGYINSIFPSFDVQAMQFHKLRNIGITISSEQDKFDLAAATQHIFEMRLIELMKFAQQLTHMKNLVYMGGCALNCTANTHLFNVFQDVWIMPNPGDAGSSLGAALCVSGQKARWCGPYLGTNVGGHYPTAKIIDALTRTGVAAVVNGRAEFGPRALGNRSLLADPRNPVSKNAVNAIKRREMFRPFAPVTTEEDAHEWFDMDKASPYMQFTFKAKRPHEIPGVVHIDGTCRVQTVNGSQHPGLHELLTKWKQLTGIPVLINTSLNIRDQPLLNDIVDAKVWQNMNPDVPLVIGT